MAADWDTASDAQLLRLRQIGAGPAEIAAVVGRTRNAVLARIMRLRDKGVMVDGPIPKPGKPVDRDDHDEHRIAAAADAHLLDLHASGGRWLTYRIPAERATYFARQTISSGCGSPSAWCADMGASQ